MWVGCQVHIPYVATPETRATYPGMTVNEQDYWGTITQIDAQVNRFSLISPFDLSFVPCFYLLFFLILHSVCCCAISWVAADRGLRCVRGAGGPDPGAAERTRGG